MRILTGAKAADMMKTITSSVTPNNRIYDYSLDDGAVLIRKADRRCIYVKMRAGQAIAIEGDPKEFDALRLVSVSEVSEMANWARSM